MQDKETIKCPGCGMDFGQTLEELKQEGLSSVGCKKCGTRVAISGLDLSKVIRGYPKRGDRG